MSRRACVACFFACILSTAILPAQQAPSASSRASRHARATALDPGAVSNGVYRNSLFGFSYKLPFGWVDRTDDMRDDPDDSAKPVDRGKALVLLAMFERPPEARGDTVNSSIVIAAESVASYPGLKSTAQYFGPLNEAVGQQGLQPGGDPYEFLVDGRAIARCDYARPPGSITLHQSTLVMLAKGFVVSLTFVSGSDDELTELIDRLTFTKTAPSGRK